MKRLFSIGIAALGVFLATAGGAWAQGYYPGAPGVYPGYQRPNFGAAPTPALSPYLNLLRGGDPAANYYLGVLPELDRRANAIQFQSSINTIQQRLGLETTPEGILSIPRETGHPSYFLTYGSYYTFGVARPGQALATPQTPPRRGR
jgi:hypothetical protein